MSTVVPFDDGHRFVVGVRVLIPVITLISGFAGAIASDLTTASELATASDLASTGALSSGTSFLYPALLYFSVRGAIVGYVSGFVGASLAIVASRWSRWSSGLAASIGLAAPFVIVDLLFRVPDDFLGLMPPLWISLTMAVVGGIVVALLPHPTLHIEWSTIFGRNKYMLFIAPIEGEKTAEMAELSRRLDEWDPIGVYDFMTADQWPSGEYDDLVVPILEVLQAGVRPHELARELVAVLKHDYGLTVSIHDAEPIAAALVEWYDATPERENA